MKPFIVRPENRLAFLRWRWNHMLRDGRFTPFLEADEWHYPIPERIALEIIPYWPVWRHRDGRLVSAHVERLALEWRAARSSELVAPIDIDLVIQSLLAIEGRSWMREPAIFANAVALAPLVRFFGEADPDVKIELVAAGLLAAIEGRTEQTRIRLGTRWLRKDGRLDVRPADDVGWRDYLRWLLTEALPSVRRHKRECRLAEEGPPAPPVDPTTDLYLDQLLDLASPAERELLNPMRDGLTVTEAARELGISEAAARRRLHAFRKKVL